MVHSFSEWKIHDGYFDWLRCPQTRDSKHILLDLPAVHSHAIAPLVKICCITQAAFCLLSFCHQLTACDRLLVRMTRNNRSPFSLLNDFKLFKPAWTTANDRCLIVTRLRVDVCQCYKRHSTVACLKILHFETLYFINGVFFLVTQADACRSNRTTENNASYLKRCGLIKNEPFGLRGWNFRNGSNGSFLTIRHVQWLMRHLHEKCWTNTYESTKVCW